jgi:outer membrane lipoprotein-sorting protein
MVRSSWQKRIGWAVFVAVFQICAGGFRLPAQSAVLDNAAVIRGIDESVKARMQNVAGYTATEHYAVFRGQDETHPAAEMLVKTVYTRGAGKSFTILSQSGSALLRNEMLGTLLSNEKKMSEPGNVGTALIDTDNYQMKLAPNSHQQLDGRDCLMMELTPKRNSPYLFKGTLWVDATDYAIVQLKGTASKSPFFLTNAAQVTRQYANVNGFPMATHAMAVSSSSLLGQTIMKIDYKDYQIDIRPDGDRNAQLAPRN